MSFCRDGPDDQHADSERRTRKPFHATDGNGTSKARDGSLQRRPVVVGRIASVAVRSQSRLIQPTTNERGGRSLCRPRPRILERIDYFRLVIAVRSAESLAIPVAPHQLEPKPPGLVGVMNEVLRFLVV